MSYQSSNSAKRGNGGSSSFFLNKFKIASALWLRHCLAVLTGTYSLSLLFGCAVNSLGQKYSTGRTSDCRTEVFILSVPNSNICCDLELHLHDKDWVCVAAKDIITKTLSSYWAYVIPLLPWLLNLLLDKYRHSYFQYSRSSFHYGSSSRSFMHFVEPHLRRLILYTFIFLFRLYILYLGADIIQQFLQQQSKASDSCWYKHLVRSNSCKDHFDFSDHVCLFFVNYIVPLSVEISYAACFLSSAQAQTSVSSSSSGDTSGLPNDIEVYEYMQGLKTSSSSPLTSTESELATDDANLRLLQSVQKFHTFRFRVVLVVCICMALVVFRSILLTGLYFHTPTENVSGLAIALGTVGWAVYVLASSSQWQRMLRAVR